MPQGVFQFHQLNEEIVLWVQSRSGHRRLEVKAKPLLNAQAAQRGTALRQVEEQDKIEDNRRGENRIAAEEVYLDLHGIAEPSEDVNVVPTFFVVAARRVIVDTNLVEDISVEFGIERGLQDVFEHTELRFFLGLERAGIVEHFSVAVAQDVG